MMLPFGPSFYSGLSSEIKDHLVHCETSISLSAAMDQAIRIDNRIVERRQEQQYVPRPFRRNPPPSHFVPRTNINQYSSRDYNLPVRQAPLQPSAFSTPPSATQHRSTDDMDVDFARRGHLPKSNSRFESSAMSKLSKWMTLTLRCRETTSADFKWRLRLGRENPDSEEKLLLPGTLRIGPISHVGTFFVDCGADDVFMDSKLAKELKVPLTKLSNPITLRLADGDSSSTLTIELSHCNYTLESMWRQCRFTSPVFVTDCYWDTPGWRDIIPGLIGCQGWSTLTRLTVWRTVRLGQLGLRDLENLQQLTTFCLWI
ncbi:hypothetical protein BASA81_001664 [Batrachochytrium salamandrivorans]|nr:hypothetical protein BASA81_001664 [Batrachochytrium salamandrivorans]